MLLSRKQHLLSQSLTFSDDRNKLQEEAPPPPPPPPPPPRVVARLMGLKSLRAAGTTPTDLMHPPPQHQPCADLLDDENHLSTTQSSVTEKWQQPATRWKLDLDNLEEEEHQDDHDHGSKLLVQQGNLGIFHEHSLIAEKSQPSSPFLLSSRSHLLSSPKILGSPEASILEFKTNLGNQTNTSDSTHHHPFTKIELPSQRSHDPYEAQNALQSTHRKKVDEKQKFSDRQQQINKVFSGVSNLQNDQSKKMTALEQQQMEQEQQKSPVKQVNTRWEEAQPQCKFESEFDGWSLRFVKDLQTPATVVNGRPSLQPIGRPYGMIQQFKSRAMFKEENKETTGDQEKCMPTTHSNTYVHLGASQSHQLPDPGNAALDTKVIHGGLLNSGKLLSNKEHRIKREWSDEERDSCLESQSLHVRRSIVWHSCRSIEAAAAAASAATLDKHSRFQPSGRKKKIKIRRPDGTVKMMKTTCCDLELLVPGYNIAGNLTGDDAVRESELTAASVPRERLLSNSQTHLLMNPQFNAGKKTSLFHATTGRSVNEPVFPELPWDETHLKRRSKEDDSMIRSENSTSTTPGMMCNDWIPKTFSEDFPVPGGSPKSSLQNLQRHDHDKKDLSSSSSSSSIQQGHSSLCQFFVSETEVTSLNQIWGSKLLSLPENDDNIVRHDFSTNSSSTAFHGCSSPDHNNNQEVRIDLLSIHVQQHRVQLSIILYVSSIHITLIFSITDLLVTSESLRDPSHFQFLS